MNTVIKQMELLKGNFKQNINLIQKTEPMAPFLCYLSTKRSILFDLNSVSATMDNCIGEYRVGIKNLTGQI